MPPSPITPTDGELAILRVLWRFGSATVREVHHELSQDRDMGYTTVMKLMQIMAEKGLVTRDESAKAHVYTPAQDQASTQGHLLSNLLQKAFDGKAEALVVRALADAPATDAELDAIQALIDQKRRERP